MSSRSHLNFQRPSGKRQGKVVVLGGGIIGLACARELAGWEYQVEVIERQPHGPAASLAAAGMLAPLSEEPQAGSWLDICREARDLWASFAPQLAAESGLEIEHDRSGALVVAQTARDEARLARLAVAARAAGERAHELSTARARALVPELSPKARAVLHLPGEHRVNNVAACAALAVAAQQRGVVISRGEAIASLSVEGKVVHIETDRRTLTAHHLIVAGGAWSGLVPGLPALPLEPVRGQMLLVTGVSWKFDGIVRGSAIYAVRRGAGGLLLGATSERAGFDCHTTLGGMAELSAAAARLLPGLGRLPLAANWAGLRPMAADGLPVLGRLGTTPVVYATGHGRNGILLAPWTARQMLRLFIDRDRGAFPPAFSPDRFTSGS